MIKFLILFLCLSLNAFASEYIVEKADGSIVIIHHNDAAAQTLEETLNENGLAGLPIIRINQSDIPSDPAERLDRNYWKRGILKKIEVDTAKKAAAQAAKQAKEDRKRLLLKLTPAEYQEAKELGIVR